MHGARHKARHGARHEASYLIRYDSLLQNLIDIITNAIEVYYKMRKVFYYKMRQLLQNAMILLQNTTFITNCDSTIDKQITLSLIKSLTKHKLLTVLLGSFKLQKTI